MGRLVESLDGCQDSPRAVGMPCRRDHVRERIHGAGRRNRGEGADGGVGRGDKDKRALSIDKTETTPASQLAMAVLADSRTPSHERERDKLEDAGGWGCEQRTKAGGRQVRGDDDGE